MINRIIKTTKDIFNQVGILLTMRKVAEKAAFLLI